MISPRPPHDLTGLRGSTFIVLGGRFGKRLRVLLFESLLKQELDFFGATKTGDVTSRLSADCQKVSDQVRPRSPRDLPVICP